MKWLNEPGKIKEARDDFNTKNNEINKNKIDLDCFLLYPKIL
jgi:hypothetical protein